MPLIYSGAGTPALCSKNKSHIFIDMNWLTRFLFNGLAVLLTAYLLPGVSVDDYWTALWVALVLSFVNIFIKPVLIVLTIPITFITLGLFLLVINALMILLADYFVDGFAVDGFWWALLFSLIVSLFNSLFSDLFGKEKKR
jgi:putative membrane protein